MRVAIPKGWTLDNGQQYYTKETGRYVFPFTALDSTPGGRNLGRIEWGLEPVRSLKKHGQYRIDSVLIFARQTRDERYTQRIFQIPMSTEKITTRLLDPFPTDYFSKVWAMGFCETHGMPFFSAYPNDEHTQLIVEANSSISNRIYFQ